MKQVIHNQDGTQTVVALEDGALVTGTVQDATPIAEMTKRLANEGIHGSSEMRHAASIPFVFVERYCNERGISFAEFSASQEHKHALINDPALAAFRVWKPSVVGGLR